MRGSHWITALSVVVATALTASTAAAATFTVTSTGDGADVFAGDGQCADAGGGCTLRAAMTEANSTTAADRIEFAVPGAGHHTIAPFSALPVVTLPVTIDGTSQPGFSGAPLIEIDGEFAGASANGLQLRGSGSRVLGLVINRFAGDGVELGLGGGGHFVQGNYIGTDVTGTIDLGNRGAGVLVNLSNDNTIGGTAPGDRNVISGNANGVFNVGARTRVLGNLVGTDATGSKALGNNGIGVLASSSAGVVIGAPGAGNVISGNGTGVGVQLGGADRKVQGNLIGTDVTGTLDLGNRLTGINLNQAPDVTVGGAGPGEGNVVSGNDGTGISLGGSGTHGAQVQGNLVGTTATGNEPLGNDGPGIAVVVSAHDNAVGGTGAGEGNTVAFNTENGIDVPHGTSPARANAIRGNSIHDNGGLGINLGADGILANDPGDADGGANDLQNSPAIASATVREPQTHIEGSLASAASSTYTLDFYAVDACDDAGAGEGARHLGQTTVTTDSLGAAPFAASVAAVAADSVVTATATDAAGNTSEFSLCEPVNAPPAPSDDVVSGVEDTVLTIDVDDLLANDSDPDGDALSVAAVSDATGGAAVLAEDGRSVSFSPDSDVCGAAAGGFTYTVRDPDGLVGDASVRVDLSCVTSATSLVADEVIARVRPGLTLHAPGLGARLTTDTGAPVGGRVVHFLVNGAEACRGITDASGSARCGGLPETLAAAAALGYRAEFRGDPDLAASSDAGELVGLR